MSNRKLMGALSILLLAILFISVGCGDGKRNPRSNLRKVGGGVPTNQKELKDKNQKLDAIEKAMSVTADEGTPMQSIDAGTYTLTDVTGYARYQRNQDEVAGVESATINNNSLTRGQSQNVGVMGKDTDQARTILVPTTLTVKGNGVEGQGSLLYSIALGNDGRINQQLSSAQSTSEIDLVNRLNGGLNPNGTFKIDLAGGKKGEMHIRKIQTGIRITVTVWDMIKADLGKNGKKDSTLKKKISFTFRSATAAPAPANGQPAQPAQGGLTSPEPGSRAEGAPPAK